MMRRALTLAVAVATTLTLATACDSGDSGGSGAQAPTAVPSAGVSSAPGVTDSPSATPSGIPTPTPSVSVPAAKLKVGSEGADVLAVQQRLIELGYWLKKADGKFGATTQQAVLAIQKAAGIGRDGSVGPKTRKALDDGVRPTARSTAGSGYLVEINLKKQLLMLVKGGQVVTTLNTSTGSNEHYDYEGRTYLADTPTGKFKVGRQIDGMRHGPLGDLWRPKYFNGGIAVHGSPSIPGYAASHGCARLSNAAMDWIWATDKIPLKTKVWVYNA
ncbi:L,D-transpeptidase family protein [Paractinoplanes ferrugineus]|uniref:Peptidoglycan-binding protein n=1 Tax=Paractinoplanes ferrugineus TaxID=113564 RepID=A0A919J4X6_9ACTN|nr:L,D-transpeptidase family protein [Actinoplanes ferrugineus]GIE14048.1 peptidoglycan-binding protein [Actinoplanes ferrugineus]